MGDKTPQDLLNLPLPANDSGASTVRGYLIALLAELWHEEEGFSGKRPFGNSNWQYEIYVPMAAAGFIEGVGVDEDGELDYDTWEEWRARRKQADVLILAAIEALGSPGAVEH